MEYDDFVIQILPGQGRGYEVRIDSPAGQGKSRFEIPSGLGWTTLWAGARDISGPVPASVPAPKSAREIGDRLFQTLFAGQVRDLFIGSLRKSPDRGLRIRLRIDPEMGEVVALPWELLHFPDSVGFLGLSRRILIVVSLDLPQPVELPLTARRLRVLAVACNPAGSPSLDLKSECRHLRATAGFRRRLKVSFLCGAGREKLRDTLLGSLRKPFHVLHFMGHGSFDAERGEGVLLFTGPDGGPQRITGPDLATELKDFSSLRLVVLNACQTARSEERPGFDPFAGVALALVRNGVPAVIAMRSRIPDPAAITFTKTFYRRLSAGDPVDVAITEARLSIQRKEGDGGIWSLPVLFLRGPNGNLFQRTPLAKGMAASLALTLGVLGLLFACRQSFEALKINNQGAVLVEEGRPREAREAFTAALRLDSHYAAAHANLATLEEEQGNYSAALVHAEAAVEVSPSQALYQYNLGRLLIRLGEDGRALDPLQRAVELKPCYAQAFNELGNAYLNLERPKDARRAIEAGLHCDSELAPLCKNLGRASLAEGRTGEAIRSLKEAVHLYARQGRRDVEEPTYWLAEAYAKAGRRDLSCQRLRQFWSLTGGVSTHGERAKRLAQQQRCEGVF